MNRGHDLNDMRQMTELGRRIEDSSFDIVDREVGAHRFAPPQWEIARRVIHATADFEYLDLLEFNHGAVEAGVAALASGCNVVVDVKMIEAGLNRDRLGAYGCNIYHHISDADVIERAHQTKTTRAVEGMRKAARLGLLDGAVVAIGNAPTALIELAAMAMADRAKPALVIGVPVGFVSAAESKRTIAELAVPSIVSRGRKGGSPVAVAIIHALLLLSRGSA